jgi:FKBP-type peptidyl-prolyl cis-trans isomerase SlyD
MQVEENRVISISYILKEENAEGELLEVMNEKYPFVFLFGTGKLLPAFEENLKGLKDGEKFSFRLDVEEAYGEPKDEYCVNIPKKAFEVNGEIPPDLLVINQQINVTDDQGGQHTGRIMEYDDDTVRVDLNHAMAGKNLYFEGTILNVREASIDELVRKHYIPGA